MNYKIYNADIQRITGHVAAESVQCIITSPPYWGNLRDYGIQGSEWPAITYTPMPGANEGQTITVPAWSGCLGDEPTPELYVGHMVHICRQLWQILRSDGTFWLNIGDCYRNKNLSGIPWRVAFALQADGWNLRNDIIWHKPNPLPNNANDRVTVGHEYLFLFSKSAKYFFDAEAIREPATNATANSRFGGMVTRNKRSVWTIPTKPYAGAHFAAFPPDLVAPCILAGTSALGCCPKCGAPWKRMVKRLVIKRAKKTTYALTDVPQPHKIRHGKNNSTLGGEVVRITVGWEPSCDCAENDGSGKCVVFDPFTGSGTTAEAALTRGRAFVGCEINPAYIELAEARIQAAIANDDDENIQQETLGI